MLMDDEGESMFYSTMMMDITTMTLTIEN